MTYVEHYLGDGALLRNLQWTEGHSGVTSGGWGEGFVVGEVLETEGETGDFVGFVVYVVYQVG